MSLGFESLNTLCSPRGATLTSKLRSDFRISPEAAVVKN